MKKTLCVTVPVSDGDWSFSFELTHDQAFALLNSRVGDTIKLNETREQIFVSDEDTFHHTKAANFLSRDDGSTSEGLQREATLLIVSRMITDNAWHSDGEG